MLVKAEAAEVLIFQCRGLRIRSGKERESHLPSRQETAASEFDTMCCLEVSSDVKDPGSSGNIWR